MGSLRRIMEAAYKYDDKPHQLFSALRAAAATHAALDFVYYAEIVRLMDQAYDRCDEERRMIASHPKLVAVLGSILQVCDLWRNDDGTLPSVNVEQIAKLATAALAGEPEVQDGDSTS